MGFRLGRWVAYVTAAEGLGFLAPTTAFALSAVLDAGPGATYVALVLAGAVEGALLGFGQSRALAGELTRRQRMRWVLLTSLAAAAAWTIGMVPSTLATVGAAIDLADPRVLTGMVLAGAVLLATIPLAQWPVLREVAGRAWRWIPLNMAAWLAGLVFTFLPSPFIDAATPTAVLAVVYAGAGIAMALTVATLTGLGLLRLLDRQGERVNRDGNRRQAAPLPYRRSHP